VGVNLPSQKVQILQNLAKTTQTTYLNGAGFDVFPPAGTNQDYRTFGLFYPMTVLLKGFSARGFYGFDDVAFHIKYKIQITTKIRMGQNAYFSLFVYSYIFVFRI